MKMMICQLGCVLLILVSGVVLVVEFEQCCMVCLGMVNWIDVVVSSVVVEVLFDGLGYQVKQISVL